ncbi:hypothetical protein [Arthrobacter sp. lap29]|uniref:hypothetical protein n=1 Tax=Arthrobacter sp. lap29 TaxID=3056122 RepID=UPI0028F74A7E|nr:hypothetical protein [Arthrobacter sp. lap29]
MAMSKQGIATKKHGIVTCERASGGFSDGRMHPWKVELAFVGENPASNLGAKFLPWRMDRPLVEQWA